MLGPQSNSLRSYSRVTSPRADKSASDLRPLRRLMCNELYQQVHQVAYRSAQGTVDPLAAGVGGDLGHQARQQPAQGFRTVALQREEVLESW
jgi:hypothetical protein